MKMRTESDSMGHGSNGALFGLQTQGTRFASRNEFFDFGTLDDPLRLAGRVSDAQRVVILEFTKT